VDVSRGGMRGRTTYSGNIRSGASYKTNLEKAKGFPLYQGMSNTIRGYTGNTRAGTGADPRSQGHI